MRTYKVYDWSCDPEPVYQLCLRAAQEINGTVHEESLERTVQSFQSNEDYNQQIMLLCYEDDLPVGVLAGVRVPNHFQYGNDMCMELVMWVDKGHRNSSIMNRLLKAYERWAVTIGAKVMAVSDIHDNEKLRQLYEKKGYRKAETSFIKEVE